MGDEEEMVKRTLMLFLLTLLYAIPQSGYSQIQNGSNFNGKKHDLILSSGIAVANDGSFAYAPIVSVIYLTKKSEELGSHWEATIGFGESYGGIAWQFDAWFFNYLKVGAGFGLVPFIDRMPGNPILIPMPEMSIGFHFQNANLTYLGSVTGNLGYGVRATVGMGYRL
jgi:hypothetical protein